MFNLLPFMGVVGGVGFAWTKLQELNTAITALQTSVNAALTNAGFTQQSANNAVNLIINALKNDSNIGATFTLIYNAATTNPVTDSTKIQALYTAYVAWVVNSVANLSTSTRTQLVNIIVGLINEQQIRQALQTILTS